ILDYKNIALKKDAINNNKPKIKKKRKKNKKQPQQVNGNDTQNKKVVKMTSMPQHDQTKGLKRKNETSTEVQEQLDMDQHLQEVWKEYGNSVQKRKEENTLKQRMMNLLNPSRFRYMNEVLNNNTSTESKKLFQKNPKSFINYHETYKLQTVRWALNPLDVIIDSINKMPKNYIIADFGCGDATLAESIQQKTHSFDFVSLNDRVIACDMAHTPLLRDSVHVVVFCLSLMGSNLSDYILEANRVLKKDGILKIAEVESRFDNIDEFIKLLKIYGFSNTWKDLSKNLFYFLDFQKIQDITTTSKKNKLPKITLKSCLYKKR
ncbi:PREDICTED: ribosomal RNA-processing protein 8, partial [Polistes dominula]|uniref:Ribosomal RNA-processing protein 8 n=1 Tax=Polistes dominula TaxID=743375 RepID=A0ABM1IMJ8_POLDO